MAGVMLPPQYDWLNHTAPLPPIVEQALKFYGTQEKPGPGSNPTILNWAKSLGPKAVGINYTDDDTAWCGLFMAYCASQAGFVIPAIPVRARSWLYFGQQVTNPGFGDVLVFDRQGGGHVTSYIAEDSVSYHCLGGNQRNMVNIVPIEKNRLAGARRPLYSNGSLIRIAGFGRVITVAKSGDLSHNEA